jgi:hypothetical protein
MLAFDLCHLSPILCACLSSHEAIEEGRERERENANKMDKNQIN